MNKSWSNLQTLQAYSVAQWNLNPRIIGFIFRVVARIVVDIIAWDTDEMEKDTTGIVMRTDPEYGKDQSLPNPHKRRKRKKRTVKSIVQPSKVGGKIPRNTVVLAYTPGYVPKMTLHRPWQMELIGISLPRKNTYDDKSTSASPNNKLFSGNIFIYALRCAGVNPWLCAAHAGSLIGKGHRCLCLHDESLISVCEMISICVEPPTIRYGRL